MRKIIIGFSCPSTLKIGAELLKWYMSTKYDHVYIRYEDNQGRDIIFGASQGTVHPILYSNFILNNTIIQEFTLLFSEEEYQKLRDFYYNKMGMPYAYLNLLNIFVYDFIKKIGISVQYQIVPGYVCSQLIATILQDIKGFTFKKAINLTRPDDIEHILLGYMEKES
jgi:hypothetical protein